MDPFRPLDLIQAPLEGVNLIEAGAGTGKTYTITGLFLRLILEKQLAVDQILVVTFTQAATEELKDRIRGKLLLAKTAIVRGPCGDELVDTLVKRQGDPVQALDLVQDALNRFDRAAILTIHGFCQRILRENAYETGSLFDTELVSDQTPLIQAVADDFWRKHFYPAPLEWLSFALHHVSGPESFVKLLAKCPTPDIRIIPRLSKPRFTGLTPYRNRFNRLKTMWPRAKETVHGLLKDPALNGRIYGSLKPDPKRAHLTGRDLKVSALVQGMDRFTEPASTGFPLFDGLEKFTETKIRNSIRKNHQPPTHELFALCDELYALGISIQREMEACLLFLKAQFMDYAGKELSARKAKRNIQFFDDLLIKLRQALAGRSGNELAASVRRQYRAALVDEFQDTDAVQYEIFSRLFTDETGVLFMIGDPKQAIYGFRGADIFSYLNAAARAESRYTLTENWRSTPGLITAVNAIFSSRDIPFVYDGIRFIPGKPAQKPDGPARRSITAPPALFLWYLDSRRFSTKDKPINKTEAVRLIATAVSLEIVRLISGRGEPGKGGGPEPVSPGDIAVLVRTNRQAQMIKRSLTTVGVSSVLYQTENIFDSREALQMERLLSSIADPADDRRFRSALTTQMMGITGNQLDQTAEEPSWWEPLATDFYQYHRVWKNQGFIRMFQTFMANERVRERLLGLPEGERRLTNVLHLAEILHRVSVEKELTLTGLLKWLADQRDPDSPRIEEEPLRLESDAQTVKIVTIHKSKGLEFPVVFCPFTWEGSVWRDPELVFHDPENNGGWVLDLGSPDRETHRRLAETELLAENIRLFYVALTRARSRCYLAWGRINRAQTSAPAYLLHGGPETARGGAASLSGLFKEKDDAALLQDLEALARRSRGALAVVPLPETAAEGITLSRAPVTRLIRRRFQGSIPGPLKIASYSSLIARQTVADDAPDHDVLAVPVVDVAPEPTDRTDIFSFPKGARAGSFFHHLLERIDFSDGNPEKLSGIITAGLSAYGFDRRWLDPVYHAVINVMSTPLMSDNPDLVLSSVKPENKINEMEFYYLLKPVTPAALKKVFMDQGGPEISDQFSKNMGRLAFKPGAGFMKGYIDMVFRLSDRFYLVDWKSNHLGNSVENYNQASLQAVMETEFYILQYHLYVLALHQYLGQRKSDYDYEKDFGGVFYIFIRGVVPEKGPVYGIYHDVPSPTLVNALGRCLIPDFDT